jgi:hypothetical protein
MEAVNPTFKLSNILATALDEIEDLLIIETQKKKLFKKWLILLHGTILLDCPSH